MAKFEFIKSTDTDRDSPGSPTLFDKIRGNLDAVHESICGTGRTLTLNADPADSTSGVIDFSETITGANHYSGFKVFVDDEGSAAFGKSWLIGTNGTGTLTIATTGTNLLNEGLRSGDTFTVRFSGGLNTAGAISTAHTHNGKNSSNVVVPDAIWYNLMFNE